jgi:hypothetical protein
MRRQVLPSSQTPSNKKANDVRDKVRKLREDKRAASGASDRDSEIGSQRALVSEAAALSEDWQRPMHWAGFLVVGASTHLPPTG